MITIRPEQTDDVDAVRDINLRAFAGSDEADLVDRIRVSCPERISLVAQNEGRLVGRILFTPVVIENSDYKLTGMGLAPMAVLPEQQRQGIGSKLVESGLVLSVLRVCRSSLEKGEMLVVPNGVRSLDRASPVLHARR